MLLLRRLSAGAIDARLFSPCSWLADPHTPNPTHLSQIQAPREHVPTNDTAPPQVKETSIYNSPTHPPTQFNRDCATAFPQKRLFIPTVLPSFLRSFIHPSTHSLTPAAARGDGALGAGHPSPTSRQGSGSSGSSGSSEHVALPGGREEGQ